jgi:putative transcriptional regulator
MTIAHHPNDELLFAHASGTSGEAVSLLVGTHLALCPACRRKVLALESVGGALLSSAEPVAMGSGALDAVLARLDETPELHAAPPRSRASATDVPEPLRSYLRGGLDAVKWIPVTRGISYRPLLKRGGARAQLIRSAPGAGVGMHTHRGEELTLVLAGGFSDGKGHFLRGDVQTATPDLTHRPVSDPGGYCINLAVTDAPLKFTNPAVGLLAKLFGF